MKKRQSALLGLIVAALLLGSGTAIGATPQPETMSGASVISARLATAGHQAAGQHPTSIRLLTFDHFLAAGGTMHVRGQVVSQLHGSRGALAGVDVTLYRRFNADSPWMRVGTDTTDNGATPRFIIPTPARMNARYKVVFAGDTTFRGSQVLTYVNVYRLFHGVITDGKDSASLHGSVTPFYNHRVIFLQKRSCATCSYVNYRHMSTGAGGAYRFSVPAPPKGRWWWRVAIPSTGAYIASHSGTYTTQRA
jgi:hypothetical protein